MTGKASLESVLEENVILRPLRMALYAFKPRKVILDAQHYCQLMDRKTGASYALEGPIRRGLSYDESVIGEAAKKIVLDEQSYAVIKNPFDNAVKKITYGEREVRVGPQTFSLHPGEEIEGISKVHALTKYDGLVVKTASSGSGRAIGEEFVVKGPARFIPSKHERIIREIRGIPLSDTEGIYIQNRDTGEVRLVTGKSEEQIYFLEANESPYNKELTHDELAGIGLLEQKSGNGVRILTRQAANSSYLRDKSRALVLELEENEVVQIYDGSEIRIERGPKTTFLGPYERPKVLTLSGGRPVQDGVLKVALLKLGPDFIYDRIPVRTKDNAQLSVDVTYKWRFNLEERDLRRAFGIEDFVGYTAETLSSEIRAVAAQYNFEEFHAQSLEHIRRAIFGSNPVRRFEENGLEIFGIDVTDISPEDDEIADKLHEAIKQNMNVYCNKIVHHAQFEAEREEVENKMRIANKRKALIAKEIENERTKVVEQARIQAEQKRIGTDSEIDSYTRKQEAEGKAERERLQVYTEGLARAGGQEYLELQRIESLAGAEKLIVVPTDSKIVLPFVKNASGAVNDES